MKESPYSELDQPAYRIAYLIAGYIRNTLAPEEHAELDSWVNESDKNMQLFEELTDEKNIEANLAWMDQVRVQESFQSLKQRGAFELKKKRFSLNPLWIAAATLLIIAGFFVFYYSKDRPVELVTVNTENAGDSAAKVTGGITLTTEDGRVINLAEVEQIDGVYKLADSILEYDGVGGKAALHTLKVPAGMQFQVKLPDGSRVWLNASTTLQYPSGFTGNERRVTVVGEAYFEIAKNEEMPFTVGLSDSSKITVTGTRFNVMAYENKAAKEVSLVEGAVTVSNNANRKMLEPGTQARINNANISKISGVDMEEILGWKNGRFVFRDASIETIMSQVEAWYNVKVVYKGNIKHQFNANFSRKDSLAKLLRILELNGFVHFKTENDIVYVSP